MKSVDKSLDQSADPATSVGGQVPPRLNVELHLRLMREGGIRPGNALVATLAYEHATEVFTSFGEKAVSAEQVAHRLVQELRAFQASEAAVGPHLADQLALLLALAVARHDGEAPAAFTCSELTEHTRTNCRVIERFLPVRFELAPGPRAAKTVRVHRQA